jgi:hypothetical protein
MKEKKQSTQQLTYLRNHEINLVKWDNCINNAHNGSIYAFSWYLDIISDEWTAIIRDDYGAVMPLLHRKKAGIAYLAPSPFANQLGVFSTEIMDEEMVNQFLRKTHHYYKIFTIHLNKFNKIDPQLFHQENRSTYEFDLIRSHGVIQDNYSDRVQLDLNIAREKEISIIPGITPNQFIDFISDKETLTPGKLSKDQVFRLRKIIAFVLKHGLGDIYAAYTRENNLCAAVLFLRSNRKINLLYSALSQEGTENKAIEMLLDQYIKQHAEKNLTINFENLAHPEKEKICEGFGGREYHYTAISDRKHPFVRKIFG